MAQLTPAEFQAKYDRLFADNEIQNITEATFRGLGADIKDSFAALAALQAPNVPLWADGTYYPAGQLVSYGQPERFYRSKLAGVLPAPAGGGPADTNWLLSDPPPAPTDLSQALTLDNASYLARHPEYQALKSGRTYDITGPWNGGAADQVVSVLGVARGFSTSGQLLSGGQLSPVQVDVAAGTTSVGGGYTDAKARAAQLGLIAPATSTVTFRETLPYPPVGAGTYALDPAGAVVSVVVTLELNAATGATEPDHTAAPFRRAGGRWKAGGWNTVMYYVLPSGVIEYSIA